MREEQEHLKTLTECEKALAEATALSQAVASQVQDEAHRQIAAIVSRCLSTVFEEPYQFKIHFEQKRSKTEALMVFERNGQEIDPMTAVGGGVIAVASFALRLACLMLSRPQKRRLLVMDEPFTHLSKEYVDNARDMLLMLSREFGFQIIMVSHVEGLKCGTVIVL